ncbi:MAG: hypothetical protein B7Z55_16485 [Planctomycetales bacterium 12-60-4]|nr:MAG: hypothetical protein B7Z55_16485 [Planctomycetales bacterium 12-60-4]
MDYDRWCGPSPVLPYMRARHHRWWRGHRAYGGGVLMDWIGHHNDIAHWSLDLDRSGPTRVEAVGWEFPATEVYNTPAKYTIRCDYQGGLSSTISSEHPIGTKWIGADGWLYVTRTKLEASDSRWLQDDFNAGPEKLPESLDHTRNFLDCMKSRQPCIAPAETAHRSITPGHLAYVSHAIGTALTWDPTTETIVDNSPAQTILMQAHYRRPWTL